MAAGARPEEQVRVQVVVAEVLAHAAGGWCWLWGQGVVGGRAGFVPAGEVGAAVNADDFDGGWTSSFGLAVAVPFFCFPVDSGPESGDAAGCIAAHQVHFVGTAVE